MIQLNDILSYKQYLIEIRRLIHAHPGVGFELEETASLVSNELRKMGFTVYDHVGKSSVVGFLEGTIKNRIVGLRADMDALNVAEENDVSYKSIYEGKMHACGHDAHTAMLLTTCKYLSEHPNLTRPSLMVIFQAAEEGPYPGGAKLVLESGLLSAVTEFYALHVTNALNSGQVGIKKGLAFACADELKISLYGKGTHAAEPHKGIDPILMQAEVIMLLQTLISRTMNPVHNAVISIGEVHSGSSFNVIPEKAVLKGTLRTFEDIDRSMLIQNIDKVLKGVTTIYGGSYSFEIGCGYPAVYNDTQCYEKMRQTVGKSLGQDAFIELKEPYMLGEDFAYYANYQKGCMAWLGTGNIDKGYIYNNHHPKFDIDEEALINGVLLFINLAIDE